MKENHHGQGVEDMVAWLNASFAPARVMDTMVDGWVRKDGFRWMGSLDGVEWSRMDDSKKKC